MKLTSEGVVALTIIVLVLGFAIFLFIVTSPKGESPLKSYSIELRRDFKRQTGEVVQRGIKADGRIIHAVILRESDARWMLRHALMTADSTLFPY